LILKVSICWLSGWGEISERLINGMDDLIYGLTGLFNSKDSMSVLTPGSD
jgi:hypothetical protein